MHESARYWNVPPISDFTNTSYDYHRWDVGRVDIERLLTQPHGHISSECKPRISTGSDFVPNPLRKRQVKSDHSTEDMVKVLMNVIQKWLCQVYPICAGELTQAGYRKSSIHGYLNNRSRCVLRILDPRLKVENARIGILRLMMLHVALHGIH